MIRIYVPRPYNGPYPVGKCEVCNDDTTCKSKCGKFFYCSVCQYYKKDKRGRKIAA